MYPKARLDALTDGLFAVAMTLLALDIRLPEDFHPGDQRELIAALLALWPKFFPYVISFLVLGLRWLSGITIRSQSESVGPIYVRWWLIYLLLITCVPFTTIVVGRFSSQAPAIWLYAGNTALITAVAAAMMRATADIEPGRHVRLRHVSLAVLFASSIVAIVTSFISPNLAMWAYMLNFATPILARLHRAGGEDKI
jgi:uncharacterized membrane protein